MATDREEIEHLKHRVDELSGELHHTRRELAHHIRESRRAFRYLWEVVRKLLPPDHPSPGNAVAVMIDETPIAPPAREEAT